MSRKIYFLYHIPLISHTACPLAQRNIKEKPRYHTCYDIHIKLIKIRSDDHREYNDIYNDLTQWIDKSPQESQYGIGVRFLHFLFTQGGNGHIQSLILACTLIIIGFLIIDRPGSYHHVCPAIQYRLYELLDILCAILIVCIRIHDNVCPVPETAVKTKSVQEQNLLSFQEAEAAKAREKSDKVWKVIIAVLVVAIFTLCASDTARGI